MTKMPPDANAIGAHLPPQPRHPRASAWWEDAGAALSWGLSPISAQLALTDWCLHWTSSHEPALQWMHDQMDWLATRSPSPPDARYAHPAWQQWPFSAWRQAHDHWSDQLRRHTRLDGMQPHHQQLAGYLARQWAEVASPANWPWSNPEVALKSADSLGLSMLKGQQLWWDDLRNLQTAKDQDAPSPSHLVGQDLAITPGKVVYRNHLVELIQYDATTPEVAAEPVLIVPSCIMKYYILDLSPHNSMVKYLCDQGFTVFMLSWRNPDASDRELSLDDYLRMGLLDTMAAIRQQTGSEQLHTIGYCLGGTFLAMVASLLARARNDASVRVKLDDLPILRTVTLLAAQTDFSEPGDLGVFIDSDQISHLQRDMQNQGYLSGRQMAAAFQLLNARDLIWARQTRRYLLGEDDNGMDLMAWNADATRLPARMHSEYLHELFLRNALSMGHGRALGEHIALIDIQCPMLVVGTEKDHVSPWRSVYKITLLTDTDLTFVLASGGHNAGIVSEPGHPHRHHTLHQAPKGSVWQAPDDWLAQAEHRDGSWWPAMAQWLHQHSSGTVPARKAARKHVLGAAPGDLIAILEALKQAGALSAELEVI